MAAAAEEGRDDATSLNANSASERAIQGLSFGNAAWEYERGRPGYPREVVDVAELSANARVLDLGAGTGRLTRLLVERFADVVAVEPSTEMRTLLTTLLPSVTAFEGTAEAIPLPDGSVDAVFCAEAFHWFDWPVALTEIARVLRPPAVLVLVFNAGGWVTEPSLPEAASEVAESYRRPGVNPGGRVIQSGAWREPFAKSPFLALQLETFEHVHLSDREGMIAWTLSLSTFSSLPAEAREQMAEALRHVLPETEYRTSMRVDVWSTRLAP